jgi:MscS family membrane protein
MQNINDIMNQTILGNTLWSLFLFGVILLAGILFKRLISRSSNRLLYRLIENYSYNIQPDRFVDLLQKPVSLTIMLLVIYIAFSQLVVPANWNLRPGSEFGLLLVINRVFFIFLYISIIWIFLRLADFLSMVLQLKAEDQENKYSEQIIPFFIDFIKITVIIFGVLLLLGSVFYVNVATLIAGLGIGGLAIALAAKETLENLLGSFTIFLDKPFVVGDMVRVSGITGVVEKVGFRSTRLRTLEKSFVTLPNRKMVDSELDNLSLRTFRRANFTIGLTYSTKAQQMKTIVEAIQDYIDNHPNTNQEGKVRFHDFGSSSLEIMVVFFVDTMDWTTYLDVKQEILYKIMEIVQNHDAEFAFPSTSVYIEKNA